LRFSLLLFSIFIVLVPATRYVPVNSSTEARELSVAWEISETGNWLTPSRNGVTVSKPPLYHWILAASGFEITPGLGRSLNVLAALGILLLLYLYQSKNISLTALILFSTHGFLNSAMDARVDMTAAFFVTASIVAIVKSKKFLAPLAIGLSILAKGPVSFILSVAGGFFLGGQKIILTALFGLIIGSLWYGTLLIYGESSTLERQIIFENLQRFFGGADVNSEPWYYYIKDLARKAFPWSFVLLISFLKPFGVSTRERNFFLFGLLFFSVASGKRFSYLVPLFPWFALYLSNYLTEGWRRLSDLSKSRIIKLSEVLFVAGVTILIVSVPAIELFSLPLSLDSPSVHIAFVWLESVRYKIGASVLLGVLSSYLLRSDKIGRFLPIAISFWILFAWSAEGVKGAIKDFDRAAVEINKIVGSEPLVVVKEKQDELFDPIIFNLKRRVTVSQKIASGFILSREPVCDVLGVFEQIADKEKLRTDRRIYLSKCD